MKKVTKISYFIRVFFFVFHFYFVFALLNSLLTIGCIGYIFLLIYFIYIIKVILEMLSKKRKYKEDFVYNFMQIGTLLYLSFLSFRVNSTKLLVTKVTSTYFKTNFVILSLLLVFIIIYSIVEFRKKKGEKNERKITKVTK